jgi:hypothetical protein
MSFLRLAIYLSALFTFAINSCCAVNDSSAFPLSCGPSTYWYEIFIVKSPECTQKQDIERTNLNFSRDGIDGQWSTFTVQIGTPPQMVRLLPSITGNSIWAVLPRACENSSVSTCRSDRGGVFTTNRSSTWEDKGLWELPLHPQHYLPFSGNSNFGFDNVTLKWPGPPGMSLKKQVIAGYVTEDFYVGALGLSPLPVNFTTPEDQYFSFLGTLKAEDRIPSHSYGYTAGAYYRLSSGNAFGSLTLGGYDAKRLDTPKNLTIVGGSEGYRPMLLGIEKITSDGTELLEEPIVTALDSIVPHIWLPLSACKRFESAFGLIWDEKYELYIVNETQHSALSARNPSVTFTLSTGSEQDKDNRLDVTLPYLAFDLLAKPPFAGLEKEVRYFPLKRAANHTQYTLGRTFLQEAYLIADYDRGAISLFPAVFPDSSGSLEPHPIAIYPPGHVPPKTTNTNETSHNGMARATIIGIAVVSTVLVIAAAVVYFYVYLPKRRKATGMAMPAPIPEKMADFKDYRATPSSELEGDVSDTKYELASPLESANGRGSPISPCSGSTLQEMSGIQEKAELSPNCELYEMP